MAERAVNNYPRKSIINLQLHTEITFETLVRRKLECGRFLTTKTGWIKLLGVLTLVAAISMFYGVSKCDRMPAWYPFLFPISIGISITVQSAFYIIFAFGLATKRPGLWIKIDILLNFVFSILSILSSIVTLNECHEDTFQEATGSLGIAGGLVLLIGCAAIFLFYRYRHEADDTPPDSPAQKVDARKSIFA